MNGGIDHSPVTLIGLDGRRSEQIDAVIQQLTNDGHEIPSPFSKRELYRTATSVGIEVWNQEVKERFTNRILDRLDYEWDPASQTFVPLVTRELIEDIRIAAGTVTSAFDTDLSEPLRKRVEEWCDLHGLDSFETETVQRTVARHAVLSVLLRATLYEWYQCRGVVPPLSDAIQHAVQNAREQTEKERSIHSCSITSPNSLMRPHWHLWWLTGNGCSTRLNIRGHWADLRNTNTERVSPSTQTVSNTARNRRGDAVMGCP